MFEVVMPKFGLTMQDAAILKWLKVAGDRVEKGEPLLEIETDKATVEIPAPASGVLTRVSADEGAVVPVGQVIALIEG